MLVSLNIKNVALISEAQIDFCKGLNILSGETGAGKSVILDCINFVLGAKADKTMIRNGESCCVVSCVFSSVSKEIDAILNQYDIECNGEIIVKRKFDINGNGYIKLNGENVTATMLRRITSYLVDVHGQSEHFSLLNKSKQLECIDNGANTYQLIDKYKLALKQLKDTECQLEKLGGNSEERARRIEILNYQIDEIEKAELKEGEKEELLNNKNKINNLEKLTQALGGAHCALSGEEGATDVLVTAEQFLKNISDIDEEFNSLYSRIVNSREEISDISDRINEIIDSLDGEFLDIEYIEQRLEVYRSFSRKYGSSIEEINNFLEKSIQERDNLVNFDENASKLLTLREKERKEVYSKGKQLSDVRKKFAESFTKKVKEKLAQLAMPNGDFLVRFEKIPQIEEIENFAENGLDRVEFLFSANAGEPVKPLSKIISGGEMSRFMLAMKTQMATGLETYIFDEIDAGISGVTASIVAKQFAEISKTHQVIAISHLPQITAMSDRSLLIEKHEKDKKTYTEVHLLSDIAKRNEIIRLIGGVVGDKTAETHAENMISDAEKFKKSL